MYKIPFSTRVGIFTAKKLVTKLQRTFAKRYGRTLPIILVAGTAGKSSMTLLLKDMFERSGWKVYSGATHERCLNSVTGLSMVIGGFDTDFEGRGGKLNKILFIIKSLWAICFRRLEVTDNTILIYEVGFNEQFESIHYTEIFGESVDTLVLTNLTYEHSFGFAKVFDIDSYNRIKPMLPRLWQDIFENPEVESRLKNIALEQFKLLATTKRWIVPTTIGLVDNVVMQNLDGAEVIAGVAHKRGKHFALEAMDMYTFDDKYLLPKTFAKVAYVLDSVARAYSLDMAKLKDVLADLNVPNGRFSVLEGMMGSTLIDSTYNSDPASLSGFLDLFEEVVDVYSHADFDSPEFDNQMIMAPKHYLILGEMRELGETATSEHVKILDRLRILGQKNGDYIQEIFLLGSEWLKCDDESIIKKDGNISYISQQKQVFKVFTRAGDINTFLTEDLIRPQSWFWVKGSQNTIFLEVVVEHLLRNKSDSKRLCRRGSEYDEIRRKWS
jgi:hypothetical protein